MTALSALADRAEARFQDSGNNVFTAAEWKLYLDDAYSDVITASSRWPFLEARATALVVTAGTNTVDLPDDVWRVTAVFNDTDDVPMSQIDGRSAYRDHFPQLESSAGVPVYYRLQNNAIEVFPRAAVATTLAVDHFVHPAALSGDTDEPVFPRPHHKTLVDGALAYAYDDIGHPQQAQIHRAQFQAGVQRLLDDLLANRTDSFPTIVDVT